MLVQQSHDLGFQNYVAPRVYGLVIDRKPYDKVSLSVVARRVIKAAGLPDEYQIMDMRRTGITEMVDEGVGVLQIQSVSGHANPQSLKPYIKNTLASATAALSARKCFSGNSCTTS
jgi:hypothetical protein